MSTLIDSYSLNSHQPGKIIGVQPDLGILVSTKDKAIIITKAQLEGKKSADASKLIQQLNKFEPFL